MKRVFLFVLFSFALSNTVFSSEEGYLVHCEQDRNKYFLAKSARNFIAHLNRDSEFDAYLTKIDRYLEGEKVAFEPSDAFYKMVNRDVVNSKASRDGYKGWVLEIRHGSRGIAQTIQGLSERVVKAASPDDLQNLFKDAVNIRARDLDYWTAYYHQDNFDPSDKGIPSSLPIAREDLHLFDLIGVQSAIDKHALICSLIKEAYDVLKKTAPTQAQACLEFVGVGSVLGRYVSRQLKDIPDPHTCLNQERGIPFSALLRKNKKILSYGSVSVNSSREDAMRDRLRQKQSRKNDEGAKVKPAPAKVTSTALHASFARPSTASLALIKEDVARKKKELDEREKEKLEKQRQAAEWARNAQRLQSLVLSKDAMHTPDLQIMCDQRGTHERQEAPEKEKTKGVADLSKSQKKKAQKKRAQKAKQAQAENGLLQQAPVKEEGPEHRAGLRKQLTHFWDTKAGLTYTGVEQLFKGLGGVVKEKSGGSSHVTLVYYAPEGKAIKHELCRPHGGCNTFGFQTVAGLHAYFEACGLKLSQE
ncbi:MAG: hypothetical protein C0514_05695 [Candidatus Puniceispirillum sp.]|nr:hypothetical protein [Candidatus Puniceispirillum sp.]